MGFNVFTSRAFNEHDWPEDFHLENGNYECECIKCKSKFIGYKRRVICKSCYEEIIRKLDIIKKKYGSEE